MSRKDHDRKARLERQYRRLGTRNPVCVICGEDNPFCLERHHIAGINNHDDVVIVCRNCHRKLTERQRDANSLLTLEPNGQFSTIGHYMDGLGGLFELLAQRLPEFGKSLRRRSKRRGK